MEVMVMPGKEVLIFTNKSATGLLEIKSHLVKENSLFLPNSPEILKLYQDIKPNLNLLLTIKAPREI